MSFSFQREEPFPWEPFLKSHTRLFVFLLSWTVTLNIFMLTQACIACESYPNLVLRTLNSVSFMDNRQDFCWKNLWHLTVQTFVLLQQSVLWTLHRYNTHFPLRFISQINGTMGPRCQDISCTRDVLTFSFRIYWYHLELIRLLLITQEHYFQTNFSAAFRAPTCYCNLIINWF